MGSVGPWEAFECAPGALGTLWTGDSPRQLLAELASYMDGNHAVAAESEHVGRGRDVPSTTPVDPTTPAHEV